MLGDFWMENFPIFPIQKLLKYVFKSLLWGPETIRKKYRVVFEIFPKTMFFRLFKNGTSVLPSVNIKLFSVGGQNYQNIKQKENQRGPLGDHLKDDPASGDKSHFPEFL